MGFSDVPVETWVADLCRELAIPLVENVARDIAAWQACEGGTAGYNPFNNTLRVPGSTPYNSAGVQNYPSYNAGLQATVSVIRQGNMTPILDSLRRGDNLQAFGAAMDAAPWGTSGTCIASYGGGTPTPPPPSPTPRRIPDVLLLSDATTSKVYLATSDKIVYLFSPTDLGDIDAELGNVPVARVGHNFLQALASAYGVPLP